MCVLSKRSQDALLGFRIELVQLGRIGLSVAEGLQLFDLLGEDQGIRHSKTSHLVQIGRNRYATVGFVWQVDRPWRAGYPGHDDDQALSRSDHRPVPPAGRTGVGPEGGQARSVALARGRPRSGRQAPLGRLRPLSLRVADGTSLV